MMILLQRAFLGVCLATLAAAAAAEDRGTPAEAQAMVARAIALFDAAGAQAALAQFNAPDQRFKEDSTLSDIAKDLAGRTKGLVLITGSTSQGKTTTMSAMIDEINSTSEKHVITIEDPIEYVHTNKTGSPLTHARFKLSQKAPSSRAPSPKNTVLILLLFLVLFANALPTVTGIPLATIADAPIYPSSRAERCIDPAFPLAMPVFFPYISAKNLSVSSVIARYTP